MQKSTAKQCFFILGKSGFGSLGRAHDACVAKELGNADMGFLHVLVIIVFRKICIDGLKQCIPLTADATADGQNFRLQDVDDTANAFCYVFDIAITNCDSSSISVLGTFKGGSARDTLVFLCPLIHEGLGMLFHGILRLLDEGGHRGVCLKATTAATSAWLSAKYQRLMSDLGTGTVKA